MEREMFARTQRLLLRPPFRKDAAALARLLGDPSVARQLPCGGWPLRIEEAEDFALAERGALDLRSLVFRRTMGAPRLIGGASLARGSCGAELGFWIARDDWGLGYATEAASALIAFARDTLGLPRLFAARFADNPAAGHVLAKLGFRETGEIAARFSQARGSAAPCRIHGLDLAHAVDAPEMEKVAA